MVAKNESPLKILRRHEVEARTGLGRSSIYDLMRSGQFPGRVQISSRAVGWIEHEVEDFIASRVERSRKRA